jgi:hypothetical protein
MNLFPLFWCGYCKPAEGSASRHFIVPLGGNQLGRFPKFSASIKGR